jgi:ATP-dependent 26S proteasome regulatory subunit
MEDIGLQRAIYASLQQQRPPPRPAPTQRRAADIAPTLPRPKPVTQHPTGQRFAGKRDTLAREGILPLPPRNGPPSARATSEPPARGSDRVFRWSEIASGGRVQQQKPGTGNGLSLLLASNEEAFSGAVSFSPASSVVALRNDDPLDLAANSVIRLSIQNLGSRGRYAMVLVGVAPAAQSGNNVISGLAAHFDPSGDVFLAIESWGIAGDGTAEKISIAERPVQVRLQRDRLSVELRFSRRGALHVVCNGSASVFPDTAMDGAGETPLYPALLVVGGKVSLRDLFAGSDTVASQSRVESPSTSLPPPVPVKPKVQHVSSPGALTFPELAERIESEILDRSPSVQWDDVAGLQDAKRLLNEAVILPALMPDLFRGSGGIKPWKGILLYGPPGTGKTLLAKAVATTSKSTFFNMSSSTLLMKHFGESEKMVKTLFQLARQHSPSIVFFDEIDAIMSRQGSDGDGGGSQDVMRRVRAEMLSQIDGLHGDDSSARSVVVIATTNSPWDLDEAMRRRLEKRIYVPLPDKATRAAMLRQCCKSALIDSAVDFELVASHCEGQSGADISVLCREALMGPVRRLIEGRSPAELASMNQRGEVKVAAVTADDFQKALTRVQPSVGALSRYEEWHAQFGSA